MKENIDINNKLFINQQKHLISLENNKKLNFNKNKVKPKEEKKFQPDHSMKIPNIPLEKLPSFQPETNFILLLQNLKEIIFNKNSDWLNYLAVINYLRRLLKYEKNIFNQIYGLKIYQKLVDFINSNRSVLAKNTLLLFKEIFSEFIPEYDVNKNKTPVIQLIKLIIPILISKANSNQSFIKDEANQCLELLINNMTYLDTLLSLIQVMNSKKSKDVELAYKLSLKLLDSLDKKYLLDSVLFNDLIKMIVNVYEGNKNEKKIVVVLNKLIEKISKKDFDAKLEKFKKEKEIIEKIVKIPEIVYKKKDVNKPNRNGLHNIIKGWKEKMKSETLENNNFI